MATALIIKGATVPFVYTKGKHLYTTVHIIIGGVHVSLTGWTFRYVVKCPNCDVQVVATLSNYLEVVGTGLVRIKIPPAALANMPTGEKGCTHGFEATNPDGIVFPIFSGEGEVLKDPTAV